jgi:Metallo-peptidase family M12
LTSLNAVSTDLNLFDNFTQTLSWTAITPSTLGPSIIYRADSHQCDGCNIALLRNGNELTGYISAHGRYFTVKPEKSEKGGFLGTRISEIIPTQPANASNDTLQPSGMSARIPASNTPLTPVTLDILAVLSPQALAIDPAGTIRDQMLAYYNNGLSSSNTNITARYVGQYIQPGIEEQPVSFENWLGAIGNPTDGKFDQIHQQRDLVGADFVATFTATNPGGGPIGSAYLTNQLDRLFPETGFSINKLPTGTLDTYEVLAHELGHNSGAGHFLGDTLAEGLYSYSRGFVFGQPNTPNRGRDIMSYTAYCGFTCAFVGSYSSPEVFFLGNATGITGVADNALTLKQSAQFTSRIRPTGGIGNQVDISISSAIGIYRVPLEGTNTQSYVAPFPLTNTTTNTANNVQVTIDFYINDAAVRTGQQTSIFQEVFAQIGSSQQICTPSPALPPLIRLSSV